MRKHLNQLRRLRVPRGDRILVAGALGLFAILMVFSGSSDARLIHSPEITFTDKTPHALQIVPASGESGGTCPLGYEYVAVQEFTGICNESGCITTTRYECQFQGCPAGYVWNGSQCVGGGSGTGTGTGSNSCTPSYYCSDNDLYQVGSSCSETFVQHCAYQCAGGACISAPAPMFVPFTATIPPNRGGGTFAATGHLQGRPTLVRSGDTAQLYWNLDHVSSCTVTGSNGDSWSGASSGSEGKTSSQLTSRATFTLHCTSLPTGTPPTIDESVIVNIAPTFIED